MLKGQEGKRREESEGEVNGLTCGEGEVREKRSAGK